MKDAGAPGKTPLYPAPEGCTRPLRVAVVGPPALPGWVRAFLDQAAGYDWLDMTVLTVADAVLPEVPRVSADVRAVVAFEHVLLGRNRSLAPVPAPPGAKAARSDGLPDEVEAVRPDLVILLGPQAWASVLAAKAPFGCWHVDASLADQRHAGLSLLAPMLGRENTTQMALMLTQLDGSPIDLAVSWGRTRPSSFLKQREDAFLKLPGLLLRALRRLAGGYVVPASYAAASLHLQAQSPTGHAVGMRTMLLIMRAGLRRLMGKRRDGSIGWTLVLRLGGTPLDPESPLIGSHALLRAAKGWWADPFVVSAQGRRLVFVEEMANPKSNNANIACVELMDGGARRLGVALDEPGHLSFPQVFAWEGEWYMTVESSYDRRVSLYRATAFPLEWVRTRDLVTGRVCVDPTLHHHDGHWYLFTNVAENGNSTSDELFLFVADSLDGVFAPHPASPLVCDVRRARMAGKLFHHDGRLIRPAQDCGPGYGNAVVFSEVLELGPTIYREKQLSRLAPYLTRRVEGCHTYNSDGNVEVLDVFGRPPSGTAYLHVSDGSTETGARKKDTRPDRVGSMPSTALPNPGGHVHPDTPPR